MVAAAVAEMVVNVRDNAVEQLVSREVIVLPKLVTVRPAAEQPASPSLPSSAPATDMHQYNNKVIGYCPA